jgi:hypothetical protein
MFHQASTPLNVVHLPELNESSTILVGELYEVQGKSMSWRGGPGWIGKRKEADGSSHCSTWTSIGADTMEGMGAPKYPPLSSHPRRTQPPLEQQLQESSASPTFEGSPPRSESSNPICSFVVALAHLIAFITYFFKFWVISQWPHWLTYSLIDVLKSYFNKTCFQLGMLGHYSENKCVILSNLTFLKL